MSHRGRHVPFSANTVGYDPVHADFVDPRRRSHVPYPPRISPVQRNRRLSLTVPLPSQSAPHPSPRSAPRPDNGGETSITNSQLAEMFRALQDEFMDLKGENMMLKQELNIQSHRVAELTQRCDDLDQYGRRENICFTNLKVTEELPCEQQVVNLCHELGVEVSPSDLVDAHPLPSKRGRGNRCIARFHDRKKAQEVFAARKRSKNLDPAKKTALAERADKGFAIQPNLTQDRAKLLAQLKDACLKCSWEACWVDYRNCNLMLKMVANGRPVVIRNTNDILKYAGNNFVTQDYILCSAGKPFEIFNISDNFVHDVES